jgi:3-dehydroquinate dehydratase-1
MQGSPLTVRARPLPNPAVCAPLVGDTLDALVAECTIVAARKPDIIEWRVDFFDAIDDAKEVVAAARRLKQIAGGIPILFTRRHEREGGEHIAIGEEEVVEVYRAVCASGAVDLVDFEMRNDPQQVAAMRGIARSAGAALVLSFHDFGATPTVEEIVQKFEQAQSLGADVAKVAVMPHTQEDVLALLLATSRASARTQIPIVSMAMGPLGAVTRAGGWIFGSAMTFAIGASSSAPGQMPIEDVRSVIAALQRAS